MTLALCRIPHHYHVMRCCVHNSLLLVQDWVNHLLPSWIQHWLTFNLNLQILSCAAKRRQVVRLPGCAEFNCDSTFELIDAFILHYPVKVWHFEIALRWGFIGQLSWPKLKSCIICYNLVYICKTQVDWICSFCNDAVLELHQSHFVALRWLTRPQKVYFIPFLLVRDTIHRRCFNRWISIFYISNCCLFTFNSETKLSGCVLSRLWKVSDLRLFR